MIPEYGNHHRLLAVVGVDFSLQRGSPLPLGATLRRSGVNFSVFAGNATAVTLVLFFPGSADPLIEFPLDPRFNRTGEVWHCHISGLDPGVQYAYRVAGLGRNNDDILLDPYGKAVSGSPHWGETERVLRRSVIIDDSFDWQHDQPLEIPLVDSVLYELHVRGFTRHPTSGVSAPGTFRGLVEKIPYLTALGVTTVELLPVVEFDETANPRLNPLTGEPLLDYWGYNPLSFFAPKTSYASSPGVAGAVVEFKEMVRAFHSAGLEIVLDVVFNHTGEGDGVDSPRCWRGIDRNTYYLVDPVTRRDLNYSGCGNTLNCNHPVVRDHILACLRYWVTEMHVDGFRFDLASILGRGRDGNVLPNPPLLERIAADPILATTKLIAEAWDAAGLYQVGSFPSWGRWAEWNGKFRDDIRRFVKGDPGMAPILATRLAGSADLYQTSGREPFHSINFVTCHDGFTLADLVSYNEKHNFENGENNCDGSNDNWSWNCGSEGRTGDPEIAALRTRQTKNLAALLLLAHGTPMILAGDEAGRSQAGNNNAYCQDNPTAWMDWRLLESNAEMFRFFRALIALRRRYALLRRETFVPQEAEPHTLIEWHGVALNQPDWSWESRLVACHQYEVPLTADSAHLYLIANADWLAHECELPALASGNWRLLADTSLTAPDDCVEGDPEMARRVASPYRVCPRSVVVLARCTD